MEQDFSIIPVKTRKEEYLRRYPFFFEKFPVEKYFPFDLSLEQPVFPYKRKASLIPAASHPSNAKHPASLACRILVSSATLQQWISFCIWSTELDSGSLSSNTYSCTRPNRARISFWDRISFCIWSTELDSGLPSTNTYSCTRPNRARISFWDRISFCIWSTELDSGSLSSNTYSCTRPNRARISFWDRISFCIWSTELDSGSLSSNTYSCTRPNRARISFWDRISFCIWSTELDSGLPSTNTYSCTRPNRAPGIEFEEVDIELHNHRARHQSHGTSKRITTSSSITYRAG